METKTKSKPRSAVSMSGGLLRFASLCSRLAFHKAKYPRDDVKVGPAGGHVVNGNLFHGQIVNRILEDLSEVEAAGNESPNPELHQVVEASWKDSEELQSALWRIFAQQYMRPALQDFASNLGTNPQEQVKAMSEGVGELARMCAELILKAKQVASKTRIFLPPEGVVKETITTDDLAIQITGNYDGLWFDPVAQEFVLFDFKCKTPVEFPSDLHQLTCYAWLLQRRTGRPVRGVLVYVQPEPEIRYLSSQDLQAMFPRSEDFVHYVAELVAMEEESEMEIQQTSIPDLCQRCPLDVRCDELYGRRKFQPA
ncbi:MAG: PD-(D/E)XK nuclease family protein [Verrucomicrobiota bacterium]